MEPVDRSHRDSKLVVLVPAYNCEPYVEATLRSLMEQGEALRLIDSVVLTDDASRDRTVDVARAAWAGPIPLKILAAQENRGEYRNVNEAIAQLPAYIEWVLIMHADNLAKPGWLEALAARVAAADDRVGSISTSWDVLFEDGRVEVGENRQPPEPERIVGNADAVRGTILRGCWWHISSCAIRLKAYREVGGLPEGLRLKGDWDFLLRLLGGGWDIEYVPRALMTYRANPMGSSSVTFRRQRDIQETLVVAGRHDGVLSARALVLYHARQLTVLGQRLGGAVLRRQPERAAATVPMAWFTVRSLVRQLGEHAMGRRSLRWVSSTDPTNRARLELLSTAMRKFYGEAATRAAYQGMVDSEAALQPETEAALCLALLRRKPSSILEVGCGSGRLYQRLRKEGYQGEYIGVEMASEVIRNNQRAFPDATWLCASGYDLPVPDASQDCAFAYYVLEHCVFPERFLLSLLRTVKPGGALLLTFPDFAACGLFGSQRLGLSEGRAGEQLRARRLVHALVALYDSRVRLPRALRRARRRIGPFPVNLSPKCLDREVRLEPDVDAIYAASREEIVEWARVRGLGVTFPGGEEGMLRSNVLVEMVKPRVDLATN